MWPKRSHTLVALTSLTTIKQKFKWTQVEKYAFDEIKWTVARDTLLNHSDFNKK